MIIFNVLILHRAHRKPTKLQANSMKIKIDNNLAFIAAWIAFLGSLIATVDRFPYPSSVISTLGQWSHIQSGLATLDEHKLSTSGEPGLGIWGELNSEELGFKELSRIILRNKPEFGANSVYSIQKECSAIVGGVALPVIQVKTKDSAAEYIPVGSSSDLAQWISNYRSEHFVFWAFIFIAFGFLLAIVSRLSVTFTE